MQARRAAKNSVWLSVIETMNQWTSIDALHMTHDVLLHTFGF